MNAISLMRTPKFVSKYSFIVDKIHMGNFSKDIRATVHQSFKKNIEFVDFGIQNSVLCW